MYQEVNLTGTKIASKKLTGVINLAGGTKDYNQLENKPSINNVELSGNKTGYDLGLVDIDKVSSAIVHGRAKGAAPAFYTDIDDLPVSRFIIDIVTAQSGSGIPSPSNIRTLSGYDNIIVNDDVSGTTLKTITIPLSQTVYGGSYDLINGKLNSLYGFISDLSTLNWSIFDEANHIFRATVSDIKSPSTNADRNKGIICSCYKSSEGVLVNNQMDNEGMLHLPYLLYIRDNAYSDVAAFKSSLSGQQFAYELATPVFTQLTPIIFNALLGENTIYANTGDVDILYYVTLGGMINE